MADAQQRVNIQNALIAKIESVTTVPDGHVFNGLQRKAQPEEYHAAFVDEVSHSVHAWFVFRSGTRTESSENNPREIPIGSALRRLHVYQAEYYYGFTEQNIDDAVLEASSEVQFQKILDDVLTAFNNVRTLSDAGWLILPPQVIGVGFEQLGNVLCHHAIITFDAYEWITGINPNG